MLSRSLRTPQLTQITGIDRRRKNSTNVFKGAIGFRFGETSMPRESSQPPLQQKSFCISTINNAVLLASRMMFCGSAAIDTARSGRAFLVISTVSRETNHDCPGAAPISIGSPVTVDLFVVMLPPALSGRDTNSLMELLS